MVRRQRLRQTYTTTTRLLLSSMSGDDRSVATIPGPSSYVAVNLFQTARPLSREGHARGRDRARHGGSSSKLDVGGTMSGAEERGRLAAETRCDRLSTNNRAYTRR